MPTRMLACLLLLFCFIAAPVSLAQEDGKKDDGAKTAEKDKTGDADATVLKKAKSNSNILLTALLSLVVVLQVGMMHELVRVRTRIEEKKK